MSGRELLVSMGYRSLIQGRRDLKRGWKVLEFPWLSRDRCQERPRIG